MRRCVDQRLKRTSAYRRNRTKLAQGQTKARKNGLSIVKYDPRITKEPSEHGVKRTTLPHQPRRIGVEHKPPSSKFALHSLRDDEGGRREKKRHGILRPASQQEVLIGDAAHGQTNQEIQESTAQGASGRLVHPSKEDVLHHQDSNAQDPITRFCDMVKTLTDLTKLPVETHTKVRELIRLPDGLVFDFGADTPLSLLDIYRRSGSQIELQSTSLTQITSCSSELYLLGYVHENDAALSMLRNFVARPFPNGQAQDSVPQDFPISRETVRADASPSDDSDDTSRILSEILQDITQPSIKPIISHNVDFSLSRHIGAALGSQVGPQRCSFAAVSQNAGPHYASCIVHVFHKFKNQEDDRPVTFDTDVMPSASEPHHPDPSRMKGTVLARLIERSINRLEVMAEDDKVVKREGLVALGTRDGFWQAAIALLQLFKVSHLVKTIPGDSVERSIRCLYQLDMYQALGMLFMDLLVGQYQFTLRDCEIFAAAFANTGDLNGLSRILQVLKEQQLQPSSEIWIHFHQMACRFRPSMDQYVRSAISGTHLVPQLKANKRLLMNALPTDVSEYHELGLGSLKQLIQNYDRQNAHEQKSTDEDWFDSQALPLMVQACLVTEQKGLGFHATNSFRIRHGLVKGPAVARLGAPLLRTFVAHFFHKKDFEGLREVFKFFSGRHYRDQPDAETMRMIFALVWEARNFNMLRAIWQYSCSRGRIDLIMRSSISHSLYRHLSADPGAFWGSFAGKFALGLRPHNFASAHSSSALAEKSPETNDFPTLSEILDLCTQDGLTSSASDWEARKNRLEELFDADCSRRYPFELLPNFCGLMWAAWRRDDEFKAKGLDNLPASLSSREELRAHLAQMFEGALGTRFGVHEWSNQPRTWEGVQSSSERRSRIDLGKSQGESVEKT